MINLAERPNFYPEPEYEPKDPGLIRDIEWQLKKDRLGKQIRGTISNILEARRSFTDIVRCGILMELQPLGQTLLRLKSPATRMGVSILLTLSVLTPPYPPINNDPK